MIFAPVLLIPRGGLFRAMPMLVSTGGALDTTTRLQAGSDLVLDGIGRALVGFDAGQVRIGRGHSGSWPSLA